MGITLEWYAELQYVPILLLATDNMAHDPPAAYKFIRYLHLYDNRKHRVLHVLQIAHDIKLPEPFGAQ